MKYLDRNFDGPHNHPDRTALKRLEEVRNQLLIREPVDTVLKELQARGYLKTFSDETTVDNVDLVR